MLRLFREHKRIFSEIIRLQEDLFDLETKVAELETEIAELKSNGKQGKGKTITITRKTAKGIESAVASYIKKGYILLNEFRDGVNWNATMEKIR